MDDVKTFPAPAPAEEDAGQAAQADAVASVPQPADDVQDGHAKLIRMSLDAGVAPIEVRYGQINTCYNKLPAAYRSYIYINSVVEGVVAPEKYSYAADETEAGERLARIGLREAMKAVEQFIIAGRKIAFVSVRVPPKMVRNDDFYGLIKSILDEYDFQFPDKLCLEFPRTVLYEDTEKTRMAILSMKLLKVKTMMAGCGEKDSPVTPLLDLPFDYVLLSPSMTARSDSRDKGTAVAAFLAFLREVPCDIIADGVYNDEQVTALSRADCYGYIPSSGYRGSVSHGRLRMPLEEAVAQKEEETF